MENVDPVSGLIGFVGLLLAAASFVLNGVPVRVRAIIAGSCIVAALIGIGALWVFSGEPPVSPNAGAPSAAAPADADRPAGGAATPAAQPGGAGSTSPATPVEIAIITTDYRRTDEGNSMYRLSAGDRDFPFTYRWIARTSEGDLSSDDCVVNTKLVAAKDGAVFENYPSNECTKSIFKSSKQLPSGSYTLTVRLSRDGNEYTESKDITILPA